MKKVDGMGILPSVLKLESWGFYLLCAFALASNLSIVVGNVFLGALVLVVLLRAYKKRGDWRSALPEGQLGIALFVLMGVVFLSVLCSGNFGRGMRTFIEYYGYRMLGLYAILLLIKDRKRLLTIAVCVAASFAINNVAILYEGLILHDFRADGFVPTMTAGGFLSMLLPSQLFLLLEGKLEKRYRLPLGFLTVLSVVALLLNGTRGAWIAVAVSCVVIGGMAV
jgi:O-antigen polymerase